MGGTFGRKTIIYMIVACIVAIGFVSQAQLSQKDEASPLYEYRAAQIAEGFGLAPSGSVNSDLEFGSVATAEFVVQTTAQTKQPYAPQTGQTGFGCYGPQTGYECYTPPTPKPSASGSNCFLPRNPPRLLPTGGWNCRLPTTYPCS